MAERITGMIFEVEVDTKTGRAELKRFENQAEQTSQKSEKSFRRTEGGARRLGRGTAKAGVGLKGLGAGAKAAGGGAKVAAAGFATLTAVLLPLVTVAAALAVFVKLSSSIKSAVEASGEYEAAVTRLNSALGNQGRFTQELSADLRLFSQELTDVSLATETQILSAVSQATALGASTQAAKDLTAAATDLASATGVDMETAFRQVNKTLGGYAGELGEIIPELKALTQDQLRAGGAAEILARQFKGAGAAVAKTLPGALNNVGSAMEQLRRAIGGPFSEVFKTYLNQVAIPFAKKMRDMINESKAFRLGVLASAEAVARLAATVVRLLEPLGRLAMTIAIIGFVKFSRELKAVTTFLESMVPAAADARNSFDKLADSLKRLRLEGKDEQDGINVPQGPQLPDASTLGFGLMEIAQAQEQLDKLSTAYADFQTLIVSDATTTAAEKMKLLTLGQERAVESVKKLVEIGLPERLAQDWVEALNISINFADDLTDSLDPLVQSLLTMQIEVDNIVPSIAALNELFEDNIISQSAYAASVAVLVARLAELQSAGAVLSDEQESMVGKTAEWIGALTTFNDALGSFESNFISSTLSVAGASETMAQGMAASFNALGSMANSLDGILGKQNKFSKGMRKSMAGLLAVAGIISIYTGAVDIAKGIATYDPVLIGAGALEIVEGIAALAKAKELGSSQGGAGSAGGGSAGGGGSPAAASQRAQDNARFRLDPNQEPGTGGLGQFNFGAPSAGAVSITILANDAKSFAEMLEDDDEKQVAVFESTMKIADRRG